MVADNLKVGVGEDQFEMNFIKQMALLRAEYKINVRYMLNSCNYSVEHLVPLFHVLPGPFIIDNRRWSQDAVIDYLTRDLGVSRSYLVDIADFDVLSYVQRSKHNLLLTCIGLGSPMDKYDNVITVAHGVDEDSVYANGIKLSRDRPPEKWLNLVFTKFNAVNRRYTVDDIVKYYDCLLYTS